MGNRTIRHIAMFSTGLSSAYLSELLIKQYGADNVELFMTDTLWEDEDNYRFARDVSLYLKKPITVVQDGRTPEQVFFDKRFFGNYGTAPCSTELKMKQTVLYVEGLRLQGIEPILYFGIGSHEKKRAPRIEYNYSHNCIEPVECRFPLMDMDVSHDDMEIICREKWGFEPPRMYLYGFSHANCGGRCVKGGINHYKQLYLAWPERFAAQVEMEKRFRETINDYTLLKKYAGKVDGEDYYRPYPLEELQQDIKRDGIQMDLFIPAQEELPCTCIY